MNVLLDTNIIIERESLHINQRGIGSLFYWLDKLRYTKCLHNVILEEIEKYKNKDLKETFKIKLESYVVLKTESAENPAVSAVCATLDINENDLNDTRLLNELFNNRVDILITEDKKIHKKAKLLGISDKVFTIESFLEKANTENPELVEYKNLIARKKLCGNINLKDSFFDSFRKDYKTFNEWFNHKAEEPAYVCNAPSGEILAFLYLKPEGEEEDYHSEGKKIVPEFIKKKRLKIGTFKIILNGYKLGERFLKIIFDNAIKQNVEEIYVTIFDDTDEKKRLVYLLEKWGFKYWGIKETKDGEEKVYVRDFTPRFDLSSPKITFPYFSLNSTVHFVPIHPEFHTDLLPDSMLNTESAENFIENKAYRNALSKIYVTHAFNRNLERGDILLFYRTKSNGPARYTSVVTTIGVIESVIKDIKNEKELIEICGKRSVFDNNQLSSLWNKYPSLKPFPINFLYVYSFPKRLNLQELINLRVISNDFNSFPKMFDVITKENFQKILKETNTDMKLAVD